MSGRRCDRCMGVIEDQVRVVDAVGDEFDPPSTELYCSVRCAADADYQATVDGICATCGDRPPRNQFCLGCGKEGR